MSLLSVRSLSLTLGRPLFEDLTFALEPGDRLGLIAANGRGKSSLLACLAGQSDPTAGEITRARGLTVALVAQDVPPPLLALTLREAVEQAVPEEDWRAGIVLDDMAVPHDLRDRPLSALSGGWQRTALLARAAVAEPDVLLLDEPTNHLDLSRIARLRDWLAGLARDRAVILTSHDRAFLDEATTRSLFLRAGGGSGGGSGGASRVFALPYTPARAALDEADAADARKAENDLAKADQLRRQAAKLKNIGINSGSDLLVVKTRQLTERAERIEAAARPAHREGSAGTIRLASAEAHAKALLTLDQAEIHAPDGRLLLRSGRLWISPGERVVLLGANGAGKTQVMQAVLAACQGAPGAIRAAASLRLGHADQMLAILPPKATPAALVQALTSADAVARSLMAGAGIAPDWQGRQVAALSGGQKARLMLLLLRLRRPNFYLLDEPTNHLDIEGQEALEAELAAQEAAALIVSHDRAFVRAVGTRFWQIVPGPKGARLDEVDGPEAFFAAQAGG